MSSIAWDGPAQPQQGQIDWGEDPSVAAKTVPVKLGVEGRDDAIMSMLKEQGWAGRNLGSMGLQLQKAWEGLSGGSPTSDVSRTADIASREAPVGAIAGDVAKYAPAALMATAGSPVVLPALGAALIGAATTPGSFGTRMGQGATEGTLSALGGGAIQAAGAGLRAVKSFSSTDRAREVIQRILGKENVPSVIARAEQAAGGGQAGQVRVPSGQTSEQAMASVEGAASPMAALTALTRELPSADRFHALRAADQEAEQIARLRQMAMGDNAAEAQAAREALAQQEGAVLKKRLDDQYTAGDQWNNVMPGLEERAVQKEASRIDALRQQGQMATEAAQQEAMAQGRLRPTTAEVGPLSKAGGSGASTGGPASTTNAPGARVLEMDPPVPSNVRTGRGETPPSANWPSGIPVPGYPRVPARLTNNAGRVPELQSAADDFGAVARQRKLEADFINLQKRSLELEGFRPLTVDGMVDSAKRVLAQQTTKADPVKTKVLDSFVAALRETAPTGAISVEATHTIRKQQLNDIIDKLVEGGSSKNAAVKAAEEAKGWIDDALEAAGGGGWKTLMRDYTTHFEKQGRLELLDHMRQLFGKDPEGFIRVIQNESPDVVQSFLKQRVDIRDAVTPRQHRSLVDASGHQARNMILKEGNTTSMRGKAIKAIEDTGPPTLGFNALSRPVMVINAAVKKGESALSRRVLLQLDDAMRDPGKLADLLKSATPEERSGMLRALLSPKVQARGAVAGAALGEQ